MDVEAKSKGDGVVCKAAAVAKSLGLLTSFAAFVQRMNEDPCARVFSTCCIQTRAETRDAVCWLCHLVGGRRDLRVWFRH